MRTTQKNLRAVLVEQSIDLVREFAAKGKQAEADAVIRLVARLGEASLAKTLADEYATHQTD